MKALIREAISDLIRRMGYTLYRAAPNFDMEKEYSDILTDCRRYSLTTIEGLYALCKALEYVIKNKIPGDIVECGVFKGGSARLCALVMKKFNETSRALYLYDTYEGMPQPIEKDMTPYDEPASARWDALQKKEGSLWLCGSLEEARKNVESAGYPQDKLIFVKGKVEDTIPGTIPEKISILRLDTDFYESTYHEFCHLFPRLSPHGVVIIDDYGYWKGSREATDKYFAENKIKILLNRIDATGRIGIKI